MFAILLNVFFHHYALQSLNFPGDSFGAIIKFTLKIASWILYTLPRRNIIMATKLMKRHKTTFKFSIGCLYKVSFISYKKINRSFTETFTEYFTSIGRHALNFFLIQILQFPTNHFETWHPFISAISNSDLSCWQLNKNDTGININISSVMIWQLWCHATPKHNFYSLFTTHVLTEIHTIRIVLFL